jgi:hypothetical protein
MELRRFNEAGLAIFAAFLDSLGGDTPKAWPESALADPAFTEEAKPSTGIERREFATRFELAEYLSVVFESAGYSPPRTDRGLWAWIACFYFNEICPKRPDGQRSPGSLPRWIPLSTDFRRYYRHLVAGPYALYRAHRDDPRRALAVLCQKPGRPGDVVEQLASRQQIVTNPAVMQVATDLFVDKERMRPNRSANTKGPGGPRRLIEVLGQFDVTWDLSMLTADQLRSRLPAEFHRA